jgi:hypothetical protein
MEDPQMANFGFVAAQEYMKVTATPEALDAATITTDHVLDRGGTNRTIIATILSTMNPVNTIKLTLDNATTIECHELQTLYDVNGVSFTAKQATVGTYLTAVRWIDKIEMIETASKALWNIGLDGGATSFELAVGGFAGSANLTSGGF